jgi:hypothetical protein
MSELEQLRQKLALLEQENNLLKQTKTTIKLSDAGYIEIFGIKGKGRFSISATAEGWGQLFTMQDQIKSFIATNALAIGQKQQAYKQAKAIG